MVEGRVGRVGWGPCLMLHVFLMHQHEIITHGIRIYGPPKSKLGNWQSSREKTELVKLSGLPMQLRDLPPDVLRRYF
jgi:hypothetical protein